MLPSSEVWVWITTMTSSMWINYDILDLNSNVPHQGRLEMLRA